MRAKLLENNEEEVLRRVRDTEKSYFLYYRRRNNPSSSTSQITQTLNMPQTKVCQILENHLYKPPKYEYIANINVENDFFA